jgi:hypothetical protein
MACRPSAIPPEGSYPSSRKRELRTTGQASKAHVIGLMSPGRKPPAFPWPGAGPEIPPFLASSQKSHAVQKGSDSSGTSWPSPANDHPERPITTTYGSVLQDKWPPLTLPDAQGERNGVVRCQRALRRSRCRRIARRGGRRDGTPAPVGSDGKRHDKSQVERPNCLHPPAQRQRAVTRGEIRTPGSSD